MKAAITMIADLAKRLAAGACAVSLGSVPDGFDGVAVADIARALTKGASERAAVLVHVARDGQRQAALEASLAFVAPEIEVLTLPAWDCQPYDRVSPSSAIGARRMTTLARLARTKTGEKPRILSTTVNAALQRVQTREAMARSSFSAAPGNVVDLDELVAWLERTGFQRASTVRDMGEYAVRGGIIDLHAAGAPAPVRLDFFGDTLESIRSFDPETQRSVAQLRALDLVPMSEVTLTTDSIRRFRQGYLAAFGTTTTSDPLYEAISEGRRHAGLEHWLPLFEDSLDTIFDYVPDTPIIFDGQIDDAAGERLALIADYQDARRSALNADAKVRDAKPRSGATTGGIYKPLPANALYVAPDEWARLVAGTPVLRLSPFAQPLDQSRGQFDAQARRGRDFGPERNEPGANVFDAVAAHVADLKAAKKRVLLAGWTEGSRDRLGVVLGDHGIKPLQVLKSLSQAIALKDGATGLCVWGLENGFETPDLAVIGEQDVLGDRLARPKRRKRAADFISEAGSLAAGDLVVHVEHGIGRFHGLKTIEVSGAPHDCVELHYHNGDKLFLPVENIELLSRYGSEDTQAALDRLGGAGWQNRKAKMKERIREMAGKLMQIAAARALREAPRLVPPDGAYDEFRARFPYDETDDQQGAIDSVLDDMGAGRPMDRLICGDVGFGKTEVALRAAFTAAMNGRQVAVVVPTTLLARQHHKTFMDRFHGLPLKVAQASRFVPAAQMKLVKAGLTDGTIDIVVGTHALLGKSISFRDLGLVIVDEEQHFGVGHKERLKELRAEVHVLTLSATPIPRTLQLAMTGVRDLSIIATPPVDRLAVRSFITPFDPLTVREALLRERYRGGQSFYVCPRIDDIAEARAFLAEQVPDFKVAVAHGQMPAIELEEIMTAFYEGRHDILLSTAIVESGLDIPNANTLIVHRADMFGLAQLYQLRGRVGRSKTRAYALFTVHASKPLTASAEKRLKDLQSLDTLGAGFQLASHDLDIRGAGNLLGDEQSGHIKEVGYELYQSMLEETIAQLKAGIEELAADAWSPTIAIGTPVIIPEAYVEDLELRMGLYRRLSTVEDDGQIDSFAAELADRFGPPPPEVQQLLKIVAIKILCRAANVEKVEAGPKGVVLSFRDNSFANPDGLVSFIGRMGSLAKVRPDMRVAFQGDFEKPETRLKETTRLLRQLVQIAHLKLAA